MTELSYLELDRLELDVGPVAHGGHCVARTPAGQVVFVRHALPGERVRAVVTEERKGYLRADAVEILTPAPGRVVPPCPWAGPGRCGGCDFQHASLDVQRELKAAVVREQLTRLGGLTDAEVAALDVHVVGLPDPPGEPPGLGWRTRVQYTVDATGRAGLLKHRSHEVVPIDWCRIAHAAVRSATEAAAPVLDGVWPDHAVVEVVASDTSGGEPQVTVLAAPAEAAGSAAIGRDPFTASGAKRGPLHVLEGPATITERAVGRTWRLPASVFWQVHPAAADTLAACVVDLIDPRPGERAWDLYGGVGLFAAALVERGAAAGGPPVRVTVVESDRAAARAARGALADLPTVKVVPNRVENALANPRWRSVDAVVLDPPRSGAGPRVVEQIVARSPRAVAYVACDPAALGRDVRAFRDAGWHLAALRAFDLFPQTHHVECVALLVPARHG